MAEKILHEYYKLKNAAILQPRFFIIIIIYILKLANNLQS